ncbi:Not1 N-terminal domain, CCR4-Not complex component-domain-containing protein [Dipodascopsis tothii]|uniref:Not1 N-terminal domain, CCR4-Not complex component-domain-containing protein n=1 Tax=Dipodascopsis tothii TaxID=44089 RepID=UPI0034CEF2E2
MTMAQRKLQQEIDRVFKRVSEGVVAFDAVYDKVQQATNPSQKEKLEQDLKREIKKLQRLRDQIKTWMGSNDIKDKKALSDQRKVIEQEMERFKACEKEMKTKAYSKEGLTASLKLDPREKEKQEMCHFISNMLEDLDRQIETHEAQVEALHATMKRGKKDSSKLERIGEIEASIERHKWHQGKLEVILRLLENGNLETEQVAGIQEDIKYYVESNQDADFAEDDEIYDDLNLDEEEEALGMNETDYLSTHDSQSINEDASEKDSSAGAVVPPVAAATTPPAAPPPPKKAEPGRKASAKSPATPVAAAAPVAAPAATPASMKPAPPPARPAGEGLKYASAAAAAAAATPGLAPLPPPPASLAGVKSTASDKGASPTSATKSGTPSATASPTVSHGTMAAHSVSSAASDDHPQTHPQHAGDGAKDGAGSAGQDAQDPFKMKDLEAELPAADKKDKARASDVPLADKYPLPAGLQDLAACFDAAKSRIDSPPPIQSISKLLESSLVHCPEASDADKPKYYHPVSPFPTSSYFPQEPLAIFDDPLLYEKVDIDTLFYVFYYRQKTYQQYLAAWELKKQSWRFHKKFLTWFQRHEEPKIITDDFEQGTYRYFDFEGTWQQRRKTNFEFEYKYLEDEI